MEDYYFVISYQLPNLEIYHRRYLPTIEYIKRISQLEFETVRINQAWKTNRIQNKMGVTIVNFEDLFPYKSWVRVPFNYQFDRGIFTIASFNCDTLLQNEIIQINREIKLAELGL